MIKLLAVISRSEFNIFTYIFTAFKIIFIFHSSPESSHTPHIRGQVPCRKNAVISTTIQNRSAHRSRSWQAWGLEQLVTRFGLLTRVTETLALRCSSAALLPCPKDSSAVATAKTPVLAGATEHQNPSSGARNRPADRCLYQQKANYRKPPYRFAPLLC